eukprot:3077060-Amphidinium_carterae.1
MMTEAVEYEWLVPQRPGTPKAGPRPVAAIQDVPDVPMVQEAEDPYYDEEEQEISRLRAMLAEKEIALAAKRRKVESTRSL